MSYKIITIYEGEKLILNKVDEPTYLMMEGDMIRKSMLKGYILKEWREKIEDISKLTEIKYMNGRKVLFKYKYNN